MFKGTNQFLNKAEPKLPRLGGTSKWPNRDLIRPVSMVFLRGVKCLHQDSWLIRTVKVTALSGFWESGVKNQGVDQLCYLGMKTCSSMCAPNFLLAPTAELCSY